MLLVEPLPEGSAPAEWVHSSGLSSMEAGLPRIWHDLRPRVSSDASLLAESLAPVALC